MTVSAVESLLSKLQGVKSNGKGWTALCPGHEDRQNSLSINQGDDGRVLLRCFAGCETAHVVDALGLTMADLFEKSTSNGQPPPTPQANGVQKKRRAPRNQTRYEVRNLEGQVIAVHVRKDSASGKELWWERPDGSTGLDGLETSALPLYGSEPLPAWADGAEVVVTEGEPAAKALRSVDITAVGTVAGAAGTPGDDALCPLVRLRVVLWADNDDPGRQHMARIAARLSALGCREVWMVNWAEAPEKGDAVDALDLKVDVPNLLANATKWEPSNVSGAVLLDDVAAFYSRYVVLTREQADTQALWTQHTHTVSAAETTPYINISSAQPESGKTRNGEVASLLVANPLSAESISPAALARSIDMGITLILDEVDTVFKKGSNSESAELLRGVLDSGWRRGGQYVRIVGQGTNMVPHGFSTFGAKMLIGIGDIPGTLGSRSVQIVLRRRRRDTEPIERFRIRKVKPEADALRSRLAEWGAAHVDELRDAEPAIPDELSDRMADSWEPLIAIADLAGAEWPKRARSAAVTLSGGSAAEDESTGVRLLADLQLFLVDGRPHATAEILEYLNAREESSWGVWNEGKGMRGQDLARILKPFAIKPKTIRFPVGGSLKGYYPADFEDSFARYLPCNGTLAVTPLHEPSDGGLQPPLEGDVTAPSQIGASHDCNGVTAETPKEGVTDVVEVD